VVLLLLRVVDVDDLGGGVGRGGLVGLLRLVADRLAGRTAAAPLLFDAFARLTRQRAPLASAPAGALAGSATDLPPPRNTSFGSMARLLRFVRPENITRPYPRVRREASSYAQCGKFGDSSLPL